jgi:hypothetical protein
MKNSLRRLFVISLGAMLLAVATLPSQAAQRPAPLTRTYDGLRSVLIITRREARITSLQRAAHASRSQEFCDLERRHYIQDLRR